MKKSIIWMTVLLCVALLAACGRIPTSLDESVPQDVSTTTTTTAEETSTTTTTTQKPTTTTTTTVEETSTTTAITAVVTTLNTAGSEDMPRASFSFNWEGEEILLTYEYDRDADAPLIPVNGWTFVSEEEEDVEVHWFYSGKTKQGKRIICLVLPKSREILRVGEVVDDVGAGAYDKEAVRDSVFEDLQKTGFTYAKEDITVRLNPRNKGYYDGYLANVEAYNETDGGSYMMVYWTESRGWQIGHIYFAVDNRFRLAYQE